MHESEKWKVKVKSLSRARLLATPWTAAYQAPPYMGFSRQEYWSGVPLPSLTMEYYSAIKKNEIMPLAAATWMQLEIIILSEVSQKETNTTLCRLNVESKIWHKWIYRQNRKRLTDIEIRLVVNTVAGGWAGGRDYKFEVSRYELFHVGWMDNKGLLIQHRELYSRPIDKPYWKRI